MWERPMLRNVGRSLFRPYWPISGDLAAFPGKMDQRTVRRPKCPQIENSGKISVGRSGPVPVGQKRFLNGRKRFFEKLSTFFLVIRK